MMISPHPLPETLMRYAVGQLSDNALVELELHLAECDECEQTLDNLAIADETLLNALRQPRPIDPVLSETQLDAVLQRIAAFGVSPTAVAPTIIVSSVDEAMSSHNLDTIGAYRLLGKLGAGGMGIVYKALHTKLKRIVALKVLPVDRLSDPRSVSRFEQEMEAVGRLEHPHIVRAIDAGEADGTHYLVMEFVEGCDVSVLSQQVGPLPIADACELARQAAVGLHFAHQQGLVHRDIKPANLLLTLGGTVKIVDLGLARLSDLDDEHGLTSTGQVMGTFDYIAPEQAGDSHNVDSRADIYSLGATLYKLLTGHAVYHGQQLQTSIQKLNALATQPAPPIQSRRADVPVELAAIVHRMLAKDPDKRFNTAEEVADALATFTQSADLTSLASRINNDVDQPAIDQSLVRTRESVKSGSVDTHSHIPAKPLQEEIVPTVNAPRLTGLPCEDQGTHLTTRSTFGDWSSRRGVLIALASAAASLLVAAIFYIQTNHGTLVVEIDDPEGKLSVAVAGEVVVITDQQKPKEPIQLRTGEHHLRVTRGDLSFESDAFVIRRGERVALKVELLPGEIRVVSSDVSGDRLLGKHELPASPMTSGEHPPAVAAIPAWTPTRVQQQFLDAVSVLPPAEQITAVTEMLKRVNSAYEITVEHQLSATSDGDVFGRIQHVRVHHQILDKVWRDAPNFDYWPLAVLRELTSLDVLLAPHLDLSPLTTLPLEKLSSVAITPFHPLAPELLRAFPKLKSINGTTPQQWLARKQEIEALRLALPLLSPQEKLERVVEKLIEYNPGFDGKLKHQRVNGNTVEEIRIERNSGLIDLSPFAALPALKVLSVADTWVADLSPLQNMSLTVLIGHGSLISDLSPLKDMPLTNLACDYTPISDLSPLKGMPLTRLGCGSTRVSDLASLEEMPLETLVCFYTSVSDLSPLKRMPLKELSCSDTPISDLSPLEGMPLTHLDCHNTLISDLSPLKGMPLTRLVCYRMLISDLSPLKGMPLSELQCCHNPISDLSPLKGMPLSLLRLDFPLFDQTTQALLQTLPLKKIGLRWKADSDAAKFWQDIETQREAAVRFAAETAKLPPEEQVVAVRAKLTELNVEKYIRELGSNIENRKPSTPGTLIEGSGKPESDVTEITLAISVSTYYTMPINITPLLAFKNLKKLTLTGGPVLPVATPLPDLSCLRLLPLEELTCSEVTVRKNALTLKPMESLKTINGQPATEFWKDR
jgi:serine/threonine protein kinase/Leucine-rich repeat (LRR) protein